MNALFCPQQERLLISDDIQRSRLTKEQIAPICLTSIISVALFLWRYVLKKLPVCFAVGTQNKASIN